MDQLANMPEHVIWTLVIGVVAFISGMALLIWARQADKENYILQKATPLSLSLVNVRDDVWLSGEIECDTPLKATHFETPCIYFSYKLEEKVTRTVRDSEGKTRTETSWETRNTETETLSFYLKDGKETILIEGENADFQNLESKTTTIGKWRHSITYFPCPGPVNAVGSVSEEKTQLEAYDLIPLLVTPLDRDTYFEQAEAMEDVLRWGGFALLLIGLAAMLYGVFEQTQYPDAVPGFHLLRLAIASGISFAFMSVVWLIYKYNTLIAYRSRVKNAWRQIDVDLKMRHTLIPQLVDVAKGYMAHEQALLEHLTTLRNEALMASQQQTIEIDQEMTGSLGQFLIAVEDYPELKAQELTERLVKEMKALEEKIAHGRTVYNEAVNEYNDTVMSMPDLVIARLFGFRAEPFFAIADPEHREVVPVE